MAVGQGCNPCKKKKERKKKEGKNRKSVPREGARVTVWTTGARWRGRHEWRAAHTVYGPARCYPLPFFFSSAGSIAWTHAHARTNTHHLHNTATTTTSNSTIAVYNSCPSRPCRRHYDRGYLGARFINTRSRSLHPHYYVHKRAKIIVYFSSKRIQGGGPQGWNPSNVPQNCFL